MIINNYFQLGPVVESTVVLYNWHNTLEGYAHLSVPNQFSNKLVNPTCVKLMIPLHHVINKT